MVTRRIQRHLMYSLRNAALLPAMGLLAAIPAHAVEFRSGENPDVVMRFDNTIRYNAGWRVAERNRGIANNPGQDEGDYLFDKGDMVTNRIDLFSEFDYTYQNRMGFRISGAAWYDEAYDDNGKRNPLLPGSNYPGNSFNNYVKRYYAGPSAEFADVFAWANQKLGGTELSVKVGRHALLWGEATFSTASANSVAVDMAPSDAQKSTLSPGSTAKESLLPINQLTGTWQILPQLSLSGQYTFEWRPTRIPEGGTYLGVNDAILFGPSMVNAAGNGLPGAGGLNIPRLSTIEGERGDWGLALKYSPDWLNSDTLGFYYREFDAKTPTWPANAFVITPPATLGGRAVFAKDIKLWGISYGGTIFGQAVGAEISHRENTPLSQTGATSAALGFEGPRGDTWHALVNTTTIFNVTDYWTSATMLFELAYQELDKVTKNPTQYKSRKTTPASCTFDDIAKGCSTDSAWHFSALFSPFWSQVLPSTDLTGTLVLQTGLKGNAPTTGINEGASVFQIGLRADYSVVNQFSLSYTNFWGKRKYMGNTSAAGPYQQANGTVANYDDRDLIQFTYSRAF